MINYIPKNKLFILQFILYLYSITYLVVNLILNNFNNLEVNLPNINILYSILTIFIINLIFLWREYIREQYFIVIIGIITFLIFNTWNIMWFYILFEIILIPLILIIVIYHTRYRKYDAINKLWIYTYLGSIILLVNILYIMWQIGSWDNDLIYLNYHSNHLYQISPYIWLALLISFLIKVPSYPLHNWLTVAHVEASTIGSVILASLILKVGTFGIYLYNYYLLDIKELWYLIEIFSIFTIIYCSLIITRIKDIKQIIAYSSIIHLNYSLVGIFNLGKDGSIYAGISHGIISSALFILMGILIRRYKNRNIFKFQGLLNIIPLYTIFLFIFCIFNLSLPYFSSSFIPELIFLYNYSNVNILFYIFMAGILFITFYNMNLYNRLAYTTTKIYHYLDLTVNEYHILIILLIYNMVYVLLYKEIYNFTLL